ncbi:hypothetical protein [Chitinimonas sp.]|uniref:hypothetical protein n=1 Tax=Chitinimonas sp. TaxID=1934313 RepID=UPI0035B0C343
MKRFRRPKLKDGELRVYWGKLPHDCPDVIFAWQGETSMKGDSRLLHYYLAGQQPDPFVTPLFSKMRPSLIQELEARGYDITTIEFRIRKRETAEKQT